jgi:beta-glucosidase
MSAVTQEQAESIKLSRHDFGRDFQWGVSTAAYQIEGAYNVDGKGPSIWDTFTAKRGRIKNNHTGNEACDFYHRYQEDIWLMRLLGIPNFRFSISWPRIFPKGFGYVNRNGLDFYDRLIDFTLERGITPWVTLYHWDLPEALQQRGGWTNRDIISWFSAYVELCAKKFGDRVKHWMVLNEPMAFTGAGYFLGIHAPGKKGLDSFLPALHHAVLCQAEGARIIKSLDPSAEVGTTFSLSHIEPFRQTDKDILAASRIDALLNRTFLEPVLGFGYPLRELPFLQRLQEYYKADDGTKMIFDFDFIGVQTYTREVVTHSYFTPLINARLVSATKRNVPVTSMDWEVHPPSIYHTLKKLSLYEGVKKIYITENGAAFPDSPDNGKVFDEQRLCFYKSHLDEVLRAKREGVNVEGYFIWSFLDNFEWAEGYEPRFGLVYVDYKTQKRILKASGQWYSNFLQDILKD